MPSSTRNRASSPSKSNSFTSTGPQKANIVKRVAIEGKAERNAEGKTDGASIKMYLRIALPANSSVPGSTVPLFPEENLKILDSHVHPLDSNAVPYNFSTATSPLLKKAAKALNLPARSKESYISLFGSMASSSATMGSAAPLEERYTGHILVSQYHISYVLPKEFPPASRSYDSSYGRRSGAHEIHFMAAIDIWVPFVSKPPSYPYLLTIPVPRCLSNHIKLKIFPPSSLSSSAASLSSTEGDAFDLQSEPHVSRQRSLTRTSSYQSFADDESSESSGSGSADGYRLQGSFPSTDYMRVRWAIPMKAADVAETSDGRRRVGIKEVTGVMTCIVLDRGRGKGKSRGRTGGNEVDGVVMKIEYTGTCRGVWFPGVATMLGMDVALDAGDNEVTWAGEERKWTVTGGAGFTGFAVGPPPLPAARQSTEIPPINVQPSTPNGKAEARANGDTPRWSGSSASLLRAPLPSGVDDSFSDASSQNTPLSSIASLTTIPSSPERRSRANSGARIDNDEEQARSPKIPLSIHINMNEVTPPHKNAFNFTISGTIAVKPPRRALLASRSFNRYPDSDSDSELDPLLLPQFHVLYAERESLSSIVRNQLEDSTLDIYNTKASVANAQSLQTVLQPGGQTKCGADGALLAVKSLPSPSQYTARPRRDDSPDHDASGRRTPSRPRTPSGAALLPRPSSSMSLRQTYVLATPLRPRRDGALMIPKVSATVDVLPGGCDVEVRLLAPTDTDSEWLEFSLAHPPPENGGDAGQPRIEVASATVDGVPVRFETVVAERPSAKIPALGFPVDEGTGAPKELMTWVKVHVGETGGGKVEVTYSVMPASKDEESGGARKRKGKALEPAPLHVLLPSFGLRVGRMEVHIPTRSDSIVSVKNSNLEPPLVSSSGNMTLVGRRLEEFFTPHLTITSNPSPTPQAPDGVSRWWIVIALGSAAFAVFALASQQGLMTELAIAKEHSSSLAAFVAEPVTEYVPTTITLYSTVTVTVTTQPSTPDSFAATEPVPATSTTSRQTPAHHPSAIPTLTPAVPTVTPSSAAASSTDAVSLFRDLPFLWPIHFDFPPIDLPATARVTADTLMRGLGFAWQLCRKVYHYPLDPP